MIRRGDWRCLLGWHRRSSSRAWRDRDAYRSLCKRCGRPMIKDDKGWRVARPDEEPPSG